VPFQSISTLNLDLNDAPIDELVDEVVPFQKLKVPLEDKFGIARISTGR
jgi:hypothetical protein